MLVSLSKHIAKAACFLFVIGTIGATGASAASDPAPLVLSALTGPSGSDLSIEAPAGATTFEFVHIQIRAPEGTSRPRNRVINLKDVAAPDGVATIDIGDAGSGDSVHVDTHVRAQSPPRTEIHRGDTIVKLRPDLAVKAVYAPPQTLPTRAIDVVADISETNLETGADATLKLMLGPTLVAEPKPVTLPAGGSLSVAFTNVELTTPMSTELTVLIDGAAPFETDTTNNSATTDVEVTEHELVRTNVLVPSLGGYGAQFNQHLYAPVTNPPAATIPDLEGKVKALEPQLVRIFYNDNLEERQPNAPKNLASFIDTVGLAHEAGATINITYQAVDRAKLNPPVAMARFAGVLEDLVELRGYTNVRWVTVANEPNSTILTMAEYKALYEALDAELVARQLRPHIRLMGGDLIRDNQRAWFQYMAANMNGLLDAYSVHIYWNYWDLPFAEGRLRDVRKIVTEELPEAARKPTYITESGVRGIINMPGKPAIQPGYWADGTQMTRTNIAAFQQLWFDLAAVQLGFAGSVKWDTYWSKYDANYQQVWYLIGPAAEGWPLFPSYHALRLLLQTTERGWKVLQVAPWEPTNWKSGTLDGREKELAAFAGEDGHLTLVGLDTDGRDLNASSGETRAYSIGGLPANTTLNLALWNTTGDGTNSIPGTIETGSAGVARFEVPLHAAFSLTTVPVS